MIYATILSINIIIKLELKQNDIKLPFFTKSCLLYYAKYLITSAVERTHIYIETNVYYSGILIDNIMKFISFWRIF